MWVPEADFQLRRARARSRVPVGRLVIPLFFFPKQWVAYWSAAAASRDDAAVSYDVDSWWSAGAAFRRAAPALQYGSLRYRARCSGTPPHPALLVTADPGRPPSAGYGRSPSSRMRCCALPAGCGRRPQAGHAHPLAPGNTTPTRCSFRPSPAASCRSTSAQLTEHEVQFLLEDSGAEAIALDRDLGLRQVPAGLRVFDADAIARMLGERASRTPTPPPTMPPISSTRPAPQPWQRACCTRSARHLGGAPCIKAGT